jgi:UDP-N-acetylmuramyl pentapeptide phosphotransferase/UDP-N-acetylglucosamine-1-phosphate transferase
MSFFAWLGPPLLIFTATALATRALVPLLGRWRLLDVPNARSSHQRVTPRGGGIAPVGVLLAAGALFLAFNPGAAIPGLGWLLLGTWALAALSIADDRASLGVATRLSAQALVIVACVATVIPHWPPLLGGFIPFWLLAPALALGWLWFVNLFNFMDGIDGITGIESISLGLGAAAVIALSGHPTPFALGVLACGLCLAAAALGFLTSNWHSARVFLGDVGSVPLGFLAAALLIGLAAAGHVAAALILPAFYVVDATETLARRILRGENLAVAHRSHAYQKAALGGLNHAAICFRIAALNITLVGISLLHGPFTLTAIALAYGLAFLVCHRFRRLGLGRS